MNKEISGHKTIIISVLVSFIEMTFLAMITTGKQFFCKNKMNAWEKIGIVIFVLFFSGILIFLVLRMLEYVNSKMKSTTYNRRNLILGCLTIAVSLVLTIPIVWYLFFVKHFMRIGLIVGLFVCCGVLRMESYYVKKADETKRVAKVNEQFYLFNIILLIGYLVCSAIITQESSSILASV